MTTRILPPEEWPRLSHTEAAEVWPHLDRGRTHVVVVEEAGEIIGCHVLMNVLHAECLWVHPDRRDARVLRVLWNSVQREAQKLGAKTIATAANDDSVKRLLAYVGAQKLDGEHYVISMEGPCQPQ